MKEIKLSVLIGTNELKIGDLACSVKNFTSGYFKFFRVDAHNLIICQNSNSFIVIQKEQLDLIDQELNSL